MDDAPFLDDAHTPFQRQFLLIIAEAVQQKVAENTRAQTAAPDQDGGPKARPVFSEAAQMPPVTK